MEGASYATSYAFVAGGHGTGSTTPLISKMTQTGETCAYTYDDVGNITAVTRNGVKTTYKYDNLGQLIRVNDPGDTTSGDTGTTWTYEYDRGGNLLNKKRYAYTTATSPGTALQTVAYVYGDTAWKGKLTDFPSASAPPPGNERTREGGFLTVQLERGGWLRGDPFFACIENYSLFTLLTISENTV